MSFKVTLRKNGRPVGEMCYPSEAVAVTQATAMTKAAPGTTASVSTGTKSNPHRNGGEGLSASDASLTLARGTTTAMLRKIALNEVAHADADIRRAARIVLTERGERLSPRRNGASAHVCRNPGCGCKANPRRNAGGGIGSRWEKGDTSNEWTLLLDGEPVADLVRGYPWKWGGAGKGQVKDTSKPPFWTLVPWDGSAPNVSPCRSGATVAEAKAAAESIMRGRLKSNPRRNGQVFWTPQGPAVEAHSPTQWTSVEIESRDGGKTYSVVAYGYADGREIRSVRAFGSKTVEAAQKRADDVRRELRIRANPRRNGGAEFAFDSNFSRLMMRHGPESLWGKAPHFKGHSPRVILQQIEALVADGSMSTGTAALLRQQMRNAGFTTGAEAEFAAYVRKPRRRKNPRNGTWSAERMAAISQRAQFERRQNGGTGTLDLRQSRILSWKEIDAALVGGKLIKAPMHALGGSLRFTVYEKKSDGWHPIRVFVRPAYPAPTTKDLFDGVAAYKAAPGDIVKTRTTPGTSPYDSTTFYEDLKYQTLRSYDASLYKKH